MSQRLFLTLIFQTRQHEPRKPKQVDGAAIGLFGSQDPFVFELGLGQSRALAQGVSRSKPVPDRQSVRGCVAPQITESPCQTT